MDTKNLTLNENNAEVFPCTNKIYYNSKNKFINDYKLDILINRIKQLNDWYNMNLDYNFEIGMNDKLLVRLFISEKNFNTGLYEVYEMLFLIDGMFCMKSYMIK